jgi:hypothetical protein
MLNNLLLVKIKIKKIANRVDEVGTKIILFLRALVALRACSLVSCHCSRATAAVCMQFGILPLQVTAERLYAV